MIDDEFMGKGDLAPDVTFNVAILPETAVSFLDVGVSQCRYPVNDLTGVDMLCCGAGVADPQGGFGLKASYCDAHIGVMSVTKGCNYDV